MTYNYEQFIEITKERERLRETNEDLQYFTAKMVRMLQTVQLYDARIWANYAQAIVDPKEMVELKHDLFVRRQKLRDQMEYNINAMKEMKEDVERYCNVLGDKSAQVQMILSKIEEIRKLYS